MDKDTIKAGLKEAIYQRRSTRAYTDQPVPDSIIEEIIEAGQHAPSASNGQKSHFFVISNVEKRAELRAIMTKVIAAIPENDNLPPVFLKLIQRAKEEEVDVSYGAPVIIVTTNAKGSPNAFADTACALENMMLTASANQVGNCWLNQFLMLRDAPPVKEFFAGIGVGEDLEVCGALAVGYPVEALETAPLPRTGNQVTYIR